MGAIDFRGALSLRADYATSSDSLLEDFYVPCLMQAQRYDRLAGFFSGAIIALAPMAFADLFRRGGQLRLVCSPRLSERDFEALNQVATPTSLLRERAIADLQGLADQGPQASALVSAMSSMVAAGVLQVKIAVPRSPHGLFHDKVGVFHDDCGNRVSFVGSTNETAAAWSGLINHEQIEVFSSWESLESSERSRRHARMFEETWHNARRGLLVLEPEAAAELIQEVAPPEALEDALSAVRRLLERRTEVNRSGTRGPRPLLPHQANVLEQWAQSDFRGLVSFATGAGKTITGIAALKRWCEQGRPAIALVPSELLQQQWMSEMRREYPDLQILRAGGEGKRDRWIREARTWTAPDPSYGPRCILATYQTARTDAFLALVRSGEHLMLLADEVHRAGSSDTRVILDQLDCGARMGLSATPDRYGDPEGTDAIYAYFGDVLEPHYTLGDAIRDRRLVPYVYQFRTCALTGDEQAAYDQLSVRIGQMLAQERSRGATALFTPSETLASLLRRRARILKGCANKAPLARRLLEDEYRSGQRWLVYCESVAHLRAVRVEISELEMPVLEYHQAMPGDKTATLDYFTKQGGVLLAIKCLDEGVDIPAIDHALILASTTNPREYVQRRGRVLRTAPDKFNAVIFDTIVTDGSGTALAQSELKRAVEFASNSENRAVRYELQPLASPGSADLWRQMTEDEDMETEEE